MLHKTLAAFAALTLAASTLPASADIRLADYPQVAGVSNQVMAVDAKLAATALDVAALKSIVVGGEAASPYLGGIRFTFNTGAGAYVPQGGVPVRAGGYQGDAREGIDAGRGRQYDGPGTALGQIAQ